MRHDFSTHGDKHINLDRTLSPNIQFESKSKTSTFGKGGLSIQPCLNPNKGTAFHIFVDSVLDFDCPIV